MHILHGCGTELSEQKMSNTPKIRRKKKRLKQLFRAKSTQCELLSQLFSLLGFCIAPLDFGWFFFISFFLNDLSLIC